MRVEQDIPVVLCLHCAQVVREKVHKPEEQRQVQHKLFPGVVCRRLPTSTFRTPHDQIAALELNLTLSAGLPAWHRDEHCEKP